MKIRRILHTCLWVLLATWLVGVVPLAATAMWDAKQMLLIAADIQSSDYHELMRRSTFLGLEPAVNEVELRQQVYAYYELEEQYQEPTWSFPYTVEIVSADRLFRAGNESSVMLLEGSVNLRISALAGDDRIELSADRIVLDSDSDTIHALGSITYSASSLLDRKSTRLNSSHLRSSTKSRMTAKS